MATGLEWKLHDPLSFDNNDALSPRVRRQEVAIQSDRVHIERVCGVFSVN